jgi:uncharacterized protein YchJ
VRRKCTSLDNRLWCVDYDEGFSIRILGRVPIRLTPSIPRPLVAKRNRCVAAIPFAGRLLLWFLCVVLSIAPASTAADTPWNQLHGVNFFTSTAVNATDMWRHFDATLADRELGWAQRIGFNSARLWLSEQAWRENHELFEHNLAAVLNLCEKHRLSVMLVLFDSAGIETRSDAVEMTVGEAYDHFLSLPSLSDKEKQLVRSRYAVFAEGRGRYMVVPVGKDTPADIIFWQNWTPNPGLRRIGRENWPELDFYTDAVVRVAAGHPQVLAIDVMNEPATLMDLPASLSYSEARQRVNAFVVHTAEYLQNKYPAVVRTIGSSNLEDMKSFAQYQTVLSIHSYVLGDELARNLKTAADFAGQAHKGIILSECLANTDDWLKSYGEERVSTDEGQLKHYERTLPLILNSGIGWYAWGGMVGRMFTPTTDLVYPSGYLRPAALYLQRVLSTAASSNR